MAIVNVANSKSFEKDGETKIPGTGYITKKSLHALQRKCPWGVSLHVRQINQMKEVA